MDVEEVSLSDEPIEEEEEAIIEEEDLSADDDDLVEEPYGGPTPFNPMAYAPALVPDQILAAGTVGLPQSPPQQQQASLMHGSHPSMPQHMMQRIPAAADPFHTQAGPSAKSTRRGAARKPKLKRKAPGGDGVLGGGAGDAEGWTEQELDLLQYARKGAKALTNKVIQAELPQNVDGNTAADGALFKHGSRKKQKKQGPWMVKLRKLFGMHVNSVRFDDLCEDAIWLEGGTTLKSLVRAQAVMMACVQKRRYRQGGKDGSKRAYGSVEVINETEAMPLRATTLDSIVEKQDMRVGDKLVAIVKTAGYMSVCTYYCDEVVQKVEYNRRKQREEKEAKALQVAGAGTMN